MPTAYPKNHWTSQQTSPTVGAPNDFMGVPHDRPRRARPALGGCDAPCPLRVRGRPPVPGRGTRPRARPRGAAGALRGRRRHPAGGPQGDRGGRAGAARRRDRGRGGRGRRGRDPLPRRRPGDRALLRPRVRRVRPAARGHGLTGAGRRRRRHRGRAGARRTRGTGRADRGPARPRRVGPRHGRGERRRTPGRPAGAGTGCGTGAGGRVRRGEGGLRPLARRGRLRPVRRRQLGRSGRLRPGRRRRRPAHPPPSPRSPRTAAWSPTARAAAPSGRTTCWWAPSR